MKRGIPVALGLAMVVAVLGLDVLSRGQIMCFINRPAIALALGLPSALGLLSYGAGGLYVVCRCCRVLIAPPRPEDLLASNQSMLRGMIRYTYAGGILAVLIGITGTLYNLSDPPQIGPFLATFLLGLLWAMLLAECVLRPVLHALRLAADMAPPRAHSPGLPLVPAEPLPGTLRD